jgi:hypothetical protein
VRNAKSNLLEQNEEDLHFITDEGDVGLNTYENCSKNDCEVAQVKIYFAKRRKTEKCGKGWLGVLGSK